MDRIREAYLPGGTLDSAGDAVRMEGSVRVLERDAARVHTYTAPEEGFLVNTHVIETDKRLVVVDGQLFMPYATEVADYIGRLEKPVERFILTHVHPDHYSGFQVLTERFPAPLYALGEVKDYVDRNAPEVLRTRREILGDGVAERAPRITDVLPIGEETIDGLTHGFEHVADAESEHQLVIDLPELGAIAPIDVVMPNEYHMFTGRPFFDHWTEVLRGLQRRADGSEHLLVGHGGPTDPSAIDGNIAYLAEAKAIHAEAADHEEYARLLKERFPARSQEGFADVSGTLLYGVLNP